MTDKQARTADAGAYLRHLVEVGGSDLHLKAGGPAYVRIDGELAAVPALPPLAPADTERMAKQLMPPERWKAFQDGAETDFAYALDDESRFRVAAFRQLGKVGLVLRRVSAGGPAFDQLGLPPVVRSLAEEHRGLVLVTGPTGSGKTTTTAAMIGHINASRRCHIVTIEDPIEILHRDLQADVTQREIGQDTTDFATALRAAMRQDPDVIFVGEIRDHETVKAALQAAETGHFVIATLHTTNVTETITRIIDFFPPHQAQQVRVALAGSLVGVVSQRLLPRTGGGRAAAIEVLVSNGRVRDLILDPDKTHMLHDLVAEGDFYGMQTFDQALLALYRAGLVDLEDARNAATNAHDFELVLRQAGLQPVG